MTQENKLAEKINQQNSPGLYFQPHALWKYIRNQSDLWQWLSNIHDCDPPMRVHFYTGLQYTHTHLSDQISRSVVSDSLQPHELQHARPPCPSPTPGVHWDSRPSSQWCHPAISSSVVPFTSCPQSLPVSESFPMSQLFPWGGQNIEAVDLFI